MNITLSGIDEKTDVGLLLNNLDVYTRDNLELAILLSANPEGRNRYPSIDWIRSFVNKSHHKCGIAVHLCGSTARKNALEGKYFDILDDQWHVQRIQVNGKVSIEELEQFTEKFNQTIITQHVPYNESLASTTITPHSLLVDASGGKGISPTEWVAPVTSKFVGFAGGLGPHNLKTELRKIAMVSKPCAWVDMESSLRDENDWFDIHKALKCIELVVEA
jgi:phosphoribosylanthranilate isomerase